MTRTTRKNDGAPKLRDSVEQVWLAGLGALAVTEDEGGRLFRTLVKRGEGFERDTKARLQKAVTVARRVPTTAMNRIEEQFDGAVTGVLGRLGVPTKREITSLTRRVEGLASSLEKAVPAPKRARRPSAAKPASRRKSVTVSVSQGRSA